MLDTVTTFGLIVLLAPILLLAVLGTGSLIERPWTEPVISRFVRLATATGLLAALGVLATMLLGGERNVTVLSAEWIHVPYYHFLVKFTFDRLSVPLVILTFLLCGTIGSFATRYMHREPGYNRFFTLLSVFILGMVLTCLAGTVETLFLGWELVGLSSALLVAFFQERPAPVRNALHVWIVYRVSDAALLLAAVVMHHMLGEGDWGRLLGNDPAHPWPEGNSPATPTQALVVGILLVIAAAGKSSVHLGAFLLLRMNSLLAVSPVLAGLVIALGLATAIYAYLTGSVQTDIKSVLSFASLAQVGLIVAEIGLGAWIPFLWYVALAHLLGHACLRTHQFIRAPTLLQDYRHLEDAIGAKLQYPTFRWVRLAPRRLRGWLYRFALERGYLDTILTTVVVIPFVRLFGWFDRIDRRWTEFLAGRRRESAPVVASRAEPTAELARTLP